MVSGVPRELPQDQARGLGLSTNCQNRNPTREICKSGSQNPFKTTLVLLSRASKVDLPSITNSPFSSRKRSVHHLTKLSKFATTIRPCYSVFHKAGSRALV
ncbi:hypothetical protein AVEN_190129-1 [Araneus ventricosus]|uniref:Uncharacterized protein n=1 Tax=Araneus ventricosus TaxID=182803 RepID=A0A4Y2QBY9_ARAVE|nr:hypothetical protein AVEN_190129-1 [Araneus ventricosus]